MARFYLTRLERKPNIRKGCPYISFDHMKLDELVGVYHPQAARCLHDRSLHRFEQAIHFLSR